MQSKCCWGCEVFTTLVHNLWQCKLIAIIMKVNWKFPKTKYYYVIEQCHFWDRENIIITLKRYLYSHIHYDH